LKSLIEYNIYAMAKKEFSFNDAVKEIEEILQTIETGNLDLDKLSDEVKRASELIKQCQKKLRTTEEEINSIFKDLV
jgi:exodeoxyribonuclease VII small subunit